MRPETCTHPWRAFTSALEDVSTRLDSSKRSALALWLIADRDAGCGVTTRDLARQFVVMGISTEATAARDVSYCKSELFKRALIERYGKIPLVCLTSKGHQCVTELIA